MAKLCILYTVQVISRRCPWLGNFNWLLSGSFSNTYLYTPGCKKQRDAQDFKYCVSESYMYEIIYNYILKAWRWFSQLDMMHIDTYH